MKDLRYDIPRAPIGFRTDPAMRKAVERYAVQRARHYYELRQFKVRELGRPFDLDCNKSRNYLCVEVKGTQSNRCSKLS